MELELKKACLDAYETGGEWTLTQEETAETIVPDYCPDIARIIHTGGNVYIHSREVRDGKAAVSGTVRVSVLYTPEGEGGVRTLEFSMPFTVESDHRSLDGCVFLMADTEVEALESRMLNPRKVELVRNNGTVVDEQILDNTNAYLAAYVIIIVLSFLVISIDNQTIGTNLSAVLACFNNIGPGMEAVGPTCNFAFFSPLSKLVLIFDMLAGRLEIFPILILFSSYSWKRK